MKRRLIPACAAFAMLSACGQTGDLYLPDKTGTVVTRPGSAAPAPPETAPTPTPDPDDSSSEEAKKTK